MGKCPVFYPAGVSDDEFTALDNKVKALDSSMNGRINALSSNLRWRLFGNYEVSMDVPKSSYKTQVIALGGYLSNYAEIILIYRNFSNTSGYEKTFSISEFDSTLIVSRSSYNFDGVTHADFSTKSGIYVTETTTECYSDGQRKRVVVASAGLIKNIPSVSALNVTGADASGLAGTISGTISIYLKTGA